MNINTKLRLSLNSQHALKRQAIASFGATGGSANWAKYP